MADDYANDEDEYEAVLVHPVERTEEEDILFKRVRARKIAQSDGVKRSRQAKRELVAKEATTEAERIAILLPRADRTPEQERLIKRMQSKRYKHVPSPPLDVRPAFNANLAQTLRKMERELCKPVSVQRREQRSSFAGQVLTSGEKPHAIYKSNPYKTIDTLARLAPTA